MNLDDLADEELVAQVQAQESMAKAAFEVLMRRYEARLTLLFRQHHPCADDASDLTQELWARLWELFSAHNASAYYDPAKGPFRPWLLTLGRNLAIDRLRSSARRSSRQSHLPDPPDEAVGVPPAKDPTSNVDASDLIEAAKRGLTDRERQVVELLRTNEPISQICAITGMSQPTVWRIKQKFRQALENLGES
jgi:RNA polymerase sigma factor (sigma-70 family)